MKLQTVGDLLGVLKSKAPFDLAESWDNVGLLAGDASDKIKGVIVAVNLGAEAIEAAQSSGANVIVCHHPPIFKATLKLTRDSHPYLFEALRRGMSVIAMHTNFDCASEELNQQLAEVLGFKYSSVLKKRFDFELPLSQKLYKVVVFVPKSAPEVLQKIKSAVFNAGAGRLGAYSECSYLSEGEGSFLGSEKARPAIGVAGMSERVLEYRLEVIVPASMADAVVHAAKAVHPYEEMAYDLIELKNRSLNSGYGFVSQKIDVAVSFEALTERLKKVFMLNELTVVGEQRQIKKIAFSPGSGSSFIRAAATQNVDVYVCGEVGYHQMLEAKQLGLTLILLGHSYSERFFVETLAKWCDIQGKETKKVFEIVHRVL